MGALHLRLPPIDTRKANFSSHHHRSPKSPKSPRRSALPISPSMISPPLSALPRYNFDALSPTLKPALTHMSSKLASKNIHITLVVGRAAPLAAPSALDILAIPTAPFDARTWRIFNKVIDKTTKLFPIPRIWLTALRRSQREAHGNNYLVCQSIIQNHVLFSQEGLTLLTIDRVYTFKHRLQALSNGTGPLPWYLFVASCVSLLRQTVLRFEGRPLSRGYILRCYDHLSFNDDLLSLISRVYEEEFGEIGIVEDVGSDSDSDSDESVDMKTRIPRGVNGWMPAHRSGPITPKEKADITPVTGGEWDQLLGQQCKHGAGPGVGLLSTSPCGGAMM
jgi:hypothetical protein